MSDPVERLRDAWQRELPDLDTEAMTTIALLNRVRGLAMKQIEDRLTSMGSSLADVDVLSTLRRSGSPYRMMPSALSRSVLLSPSGMTSRIDQLESAGLVRRVVDPSNRRTVPVELTDSGVDEAERLVRALADVDTEILSSLSDRDRSRLDALLGAVAAGLEPADETS